MATAASRTPSTSAALSSGSASTRAAMVRRPATRAVCRRQPWRRVGIGLGHGRDQVRVLIGSPVQPPPQSGGRELGGQPETLSARLRAGDRVRTGDLCLASASTPVTRPSDAIPRENARGFFKRLARCDGLRWHSIRYDAGTTSVYRVVELDGQFTGRCVVLVDDRDRPARRAQKVVESSPSAPRSGIRLRRGKRRTRTHPQCGPGHVKRWRGSPAVRRLARPWIDTEGPKRPALTRCSHALST